MQYCRRRLGNVRAAGRDITDPSSPTAHAHVTTSSPSLSCHPSPSLLHRGKLRLLFDIAVFSSLADVVEVKTVSRSTAHWRIHFIRLSEWLRLSFAQLITLLDIDGIGQN